MTVFELTVDNAPTYLDAIGVLDRKRITGVDSLGGGVSNTVVRVRTDERCVVLKQPRANLAVEDDWPADTERVHNEAAAARAYGDVIRETGVSDVHVPAVVLERDADHIIAITCAPTAARMWKRDLLAGRVDATIAERLGRFLGTSQRATAEDPALADEFESDAPFEQLRLAPYHRTVARRHPDVAPSIEAEIERVSAVDRTLVHGDFSPKNVLVDRRADTQPVWLLDFEVAHWGDPSFDAAFMLNHLLIKSVYRAGERAVYVDAARRFWRAYANAVAGNGNVESERNDESDRDVESDRNAEFDWDVESDTVRELAVLMLARVDGKSPVEYVTAEETKAVLRSTAKSALATGVETIDAFISLLAEERRS